MLAQQKICPARFDWENAWTLHSFFSSFLQASAKLRRPMLVRLRENWCMGLRCRRSGISRGLNLQRGVALLCTTYVCMYCTYKGTK
ncbi:hypothetical protein K504DRAFT_116900 [Pleomassaria siparia CBS 279.74]|uniref:Uncharacterized protein n=1 Tax=Pleomassaria siparia CBS 279.74 TaxID=1314801 RepID=A0A6G1JVE3_9PLEO|nr:hypothetical protein K504DRAFT_116900 [Pleomassaria siparia CBS 279.74]